MSDSDRDTVDKARLKQWLCAAIGAAVVLIAIVSIQHWIHYDDATTRAANDARHTKDQIAAECVLADTFAKCSREIEQASSAEQRDEYDLYSQQAMALWTGVMGAMAILGVALSGVGVYLLWGTWKQTAEAAKNSSKTLDSYVHRERAIIRFTGARFSEKEDSPVPYGFVAGVENLGPSPSNLESVEWEYLNGPMWPDRLRFQQWVTDIVIPEGDGTTPHMGAEALPDEPVWLAISLHYKTLGDRKFSTHRAFKIEYGPSNPFGGGGAYYATPQFIADQPADT